jgi:1,4-alpha-glucan branching enzyme
MMSVHFQYHVGLMGNIFRNARLVGSWNEAGYYSDQWTSVPMSRGTSENGTPVFTATVDFSPTETGRSFRWGVLIDGPGGANQWGIVAEVNDRYSRARHREFRLEEADQIEEYHLTYCRRLGANKLYRDGTDGPAVCFSVWAPNARAVEVVRGDARSGYIADDGTGATSRPDEFPMTKDRRTGIWSTSPDRSPGLVRFADFDHTPYMYRITKDDGTVAYRTDLYSRCQLGAGRDDPGGRPYNGSREALDGSVSCSVVVDPDRVSREFEMPFGREAWDIADEFWSREFDPLRPLPTRVEDLVIYEMHVGGLGYGKLDANGNPLPGTLRDAIDMLDYLVDLGINAIELLPMSEFEGWAEWGYGSSHFCAVEYSGGGRDQFKHFVRECHRRGIAVIQDVVYNHYIHNAERAEWMYDTNSHERNTYYWYEGRPSDYPDYDAAVGDADRGRGGYVDNQSTAFAPRYWEEMVRRMFISSAVMLAHEFHVDGFRVDQTTSIHSYAVLHANGAPADDARIFGARFLRELTMSLRLVKPGIKIIAEDHSGWPAVTEPVDLGGLGFDSIWYADGLRQADQDRGSGGQPALGHGLLCGGAGACLEAYGGLRRVP